MLLIEKYLAVDDTHTKQHPRLANPVHNAHHDYYVAIQNNIKYARKQMPKSLKHTNSTNTVALNWQRLIRNAIRPSVVSQMDSASAGRHRRGGSATLDDGWFKTVAELQQKKTPKRKKSKSKATTQKKR